MNIRIEYYLLIYTAQQNWWNKISTHVTLTMILNEIYLVQVYNSNKKLLTERVPNIKFPISVQENFTKFLKS